MFGAVYTPNHKPPWRSAVMRDGRMAVLGFFNTQEAASAEAVKYASAHPSRRQNRHWQKRGIDLADGPAIDPRQPTRAMPGCLEKQRVLQARIVAGLPLHHPDDAVWPGRWNAIVRYVDAMTPQSERALSYAR